MKSSSPSPLSCYVQQLVADIEQCKDNLAWPFIENTDVSPDEIKDWDEDYDTAPVRNLISWTGFHPEKLPPAAMLADEEVHLILSALLELLAACRAEAIFLLEVPERIQYEAIRQNFDQEVRLLEWSEDFFEFCKPDTEPNSCVLGEWCQCAHFDEILGGFIEDNRTPEEQRADELEMEIHYIQRRYGPDWLKYYPYHLDKDFDDEEGNPFNYGIDLIDDDDEDDGWRN